MITLWSDKKNMLAPENVLTGKIIIRESRFESFFRTRTIYYHNLEDRYFKRGGGMNHTNQSRDKYVR